jgi:hypothetical protein
VLCQNVYIHSKNELLMFTTKSKALTCNLIHRKVMICPADNSGFRRQKKFDVLVGAKDHGG